MGNRLGSGVGGIGLAREQGVGGGGSDLLTTKGDLLTHDGTDAVRAAVGASAGMVPTVNPAATNGWEWAASARMADWTIGTTRYYAVGSGGDDDANAGYSDVSSAAAWTVRKATWAGLMAIFPRWGEGRDVTIIIGGSDTSYGVKMTFSCIGYEDIVIAGTTDGSHDATDRVLGGFTISANGSSAGNSWTVDAGATVNTFTKTDAAALPSEANGLGRRLRFEGNVTAALANACVGIYEISGSTITSMQDLSEAPAAGDRFFIERAAANFTSVLFDGVVCKTLIVAGIRSTGAWDFSGVYGQVFIAGCESVGNAAFRGFTQMSPGSGYSGSILGPGMRSEGSLTFSNGKLMSGNNCYAANGINWSNVDAPVIGSGFVSIAVVSIGGSKGGALIGASDSSYRDFRIDANVLITECSQLTFQRATITGATTPVAILGTGNNIILIQVVGTDSNTGAGLDLTAAYNSTVKVTSCTVAGDTEIKYAGNAPGSWSDLTKTNCVDKNGNNVWGSAGVIVGQCTLVTANGTYGPGNLVRYNTAVEGEVILSDADDLATARCIGVTVTTSNDAEDPIYIVTKGPAYVLPETVSVGELAYVSVTGGLATGDPPAVGDFKLRIGYFISGTDDVESIIDLNPELIPVAADGAA